MPALVLVCTQCGGPRIQRSRSTMADAIRQAVSLSLREEDPERRHRCLTAHLLWFESELRGRCTNCTLKEAAEEVAAVSAEVQPVRRHFYDGLANLELVK